MSAQHMIFSGCRTRENRISYSHCSPSASKGYFKGVDLNSISSKLPLMGKLNRKLWFFKHALWGSQQL